jgi:hypothetical protein
MTTKVIPLHLFGQETEIPVTLRTALVGDGLYRGDLINRAFTEFKVHEPDPYTRTAAIVLYPSCVACVESPKSVREMPLDDFMKLTEQDVNAWLGAVYVLNEHWQPQGYIPPAGEDAEKKMNKGIGTASHGSRRHTKAPAMKPATSQPSKT